MDWSGLLHDFILGAMLGDKESEDWAALILQPQEPLDEERWEAFLNRFGEAKFRPDGKPKGWRDFTDPFNRRTAMYVWNGWPEPQARAKARFELAAEREDKATPSGARGRAEADEGGAWEVPPGEMPDQVWPDVDAESGPEGEVQRPGAATIWQEGIGYWLPPTDTPGQPVEMAYPVTREEAEARCKREYEKKKAAAEWRRKVGRTLNAIIYGGRAAADRMPTRGPGGQRQYTMPDPDIPETALELDDYWKTRYEEDLAKAREEYERCMQGACQLPSKNARGR